MSTKSKPKKKRIRKSRAKDPANPMHSGRLTSENAKIIGPMGGRPPGSSTKVRMGDFTNKMMDLLMAGVNEAGGDEGAIGAMAWLFKNHPTTYVAMLQQLMPNRVDITVDETTTTKHEHSVTLDQVRDKIKEYGMPVPSAFPVVDYTKNGGAGDVIDGTVRDVSDDGETMTHTDDTPDPLEE